MQADFLDYYRKNLQSLRSAAADFAHAYPKIAANLALDSFACADPFVERLLEGSAFIASQVEAHLDSGYARLLQQLVAHSAPLFNTPLPALTCVQLSAQQSGQLPVIAAGQSFTLPTVKGQNCTFSALWPAAVHPLSAQNWTYHHNVAAELPELRLGAQAKSVLACDVTLKVPQSAARSWLERQQQPQAVGALELFCNMPESTAAALYQLLRHDQIAVYVRTTELNGRTRLQQLEPLTAVASLYQQPSYLQEVVGGASALDYLALYLNYPQLCKFIRLSNLLAQWLKLNLSSGRLIVVFKRELNIALELSILTDVVPLINVFSARSNRTALTLRSDYQIQIDRTHPLDYEVLAISVLECYDQQQRLRFVAHPLTGLRPLPDTPEVNSVSFSCERRLPQVRPNPRSPYPISNMFVALSGPAYRQAYNEALAALENKLWEPNTAPVPQAAVRDLGLDLVAQCYCSNGDLPYFLTQDASVRSSNDVLHGTIVGDVTKMVPARLTTVTDDELKLLSLVLINTTALLRQPNQEIVAYLRSLLLTLGNHSLEVEQLAQCLVSFSREPQTFRRIKQGVVFFEEGTRLTVTLDESKLGGSGLMFVAELWAQVLLSALAVNTQAQVQVRTTTGMEVGVWTH